MMTRRVTESERKQDLKLGDLGGMGEMLEKCHQRKRAGREGGSG